MRLKITFFFRKSIFHFSVFKSSALTTCYSYLHGNLMSFKVKLIAFSLTKASYLKLSNLLCEVKNTYFKWILPLGIRYILLFFCLFIGTSCTTFRYYHSNHEFKERTYNPVKRGRIELTVYGETTFSERPGAITNWKRAHEKGLKAVKHSIKQFCEGQYIIKTIAEKKENLGTQTDTSYHSDYSSQRDSYGQGVQSGYDSGYARSDSLMGKIMGGAYAQSDTSSRYGYSDSHSTTRTAPVFREYTDITFQCKK